MIFALLNIASDITLNIAWWTTKTIISGLYSTTTNLLGKGCTKNNNNLLEKNKDENDKDEKINILMNKIDILLQDMDNLLENNLLEKGCTKTKN